MGKNIEKNGGPLLQVVEPQSLHENQSKDLIIHCKPCVLRQFYACDWFRKGIDLLKLAKNKWIEDYSNQELAKMFDLSPITIGQRLRRLKKSDSLEELGLTKREASKIRKKWNA